MRFAAEKRVASFFAAAAIVLAWGWLPTGSQLVAAQETTVVARVCQAGTTASLVITAPQPNTVTSEAPIMITAQVEQLSQITIYVDGQYSETVPVDQSASNFVYAFRAAVGTHTVRLEGQDLCARTTPVGEITVTYDPEQPSEPITGPSTPTNTSGVPSASGGTRAAAATTSDSQSPEVPSFLTQPLKAFGDAAYAMLVLLDIVQPQSAQPLKSALQFIVMLVGVALLLAAGLILRLLHHVLPLALRKFLATALPAVFLRHPKAVVRMVGAVLIVIAAWLLS